MLARGKDWAIGSKRLFSPIPEAALHNSADLSRCHGPERTAPALAAVAIDPRSVNHRMAGRRQTTSGPGGRVRLGPALAAAALSLSACASLPTSGPTVHQVVKQSRSGQTIMPFTLVPLDVDALRRAAPPPDPGIARLAALGSGPAPLRADMILPGDTLSIAVFEVGVSLFGPGGPPAAGAAGPRPPAAAPPHRPRAPPRRGRAAGEAAGGGAVGRAAGRGGRALGRDGARGGNHQDGGCGVRGAFRGASASRQVVPGCCLSRRGPYSGLRRRSPSGIPPLDANPAATLAVPHRRGVIRSGDEAGGSYVGKEIANLEPAVSRPEADAPGPAP